MQALTIETNGEAFRLSSHDEESAVGTAPHLSQLFAFFSCGQNALATIDQWRHAWRQAAWFSKPLTCQAP
jgi:hypothetical protein